MRHIVKTHSLALFLIASFFVFVTAGATKAIAKDKPFLNIQEVTSPGGITAWLVEDHSIPVISVEYAFRGAGSKTDPEDKQGLARMVSNTMDEGAGDLTSQDFQKELQDLSITLNFTVGRDTFGGQLKTLSKNRDRAFELLTLAVNKPRFDDEPVARMREANKSRIKSSMSDPNWIAARLQNDRIFEGHPYAFNSGGTLTSLDKITPDDLRTFHAGLGKNNLVIGVSGDITAQELAGVLDNVFSSLPDVPRKDDEKIGLRNGGKTYLYKKDIPQTVIEIAQKGIGRNDPDYYAAQVMNYILGGAGFGSRLMDEVREKKGLTYGIYTYFDNYDDVDVYHVTTSTVNESAAQVLALIKTEWAKMKDAPPSTKELDDARSYLIGSLPLSLTSSDSIAQVLLSLQLDHLPIDYLDQRREKLNALSVTDIQYVAKRLLDSESFTTILVGNPVGVDGAEMVETLPNVE